MRPIHPGLLKKQHVGDFNARDGSLTAVAAAGDPSVETKTLESQEAIASQLTALEKLMQEMDPEAEDVLAALFPTLTACVDHALLKRLKAQVAGFEFEDGLKTLSEVKGRCV